MLVTVMTMMMVTMVMGIRDAVMLVTTMTMTVAIR